MKDHPVNPGDLEALILERAREGLAPSPSRRRSALAGIAAGLSLPPPAMPSTVGTLGSAGSSGAAKAGTAASGLSFKAVVVGVVATAVVGAGVYLTVESANRSAVPPEPAPNTAPASASGETRLLAASAHARAGRSAPPARTTAKPTSTASAPTDPVRRGGPPAKPTKRTIVADAAREAPDAARELAALRQAQSALARGDGAMALRLMRHLDETDPSGVLAAERAVTKVLALCQLGRSAEAKAVARRTLRDGQGTALYRRRLATSCARIDDEK